MAKTESRSAIVSSSLQGAPPFNIKLNKIYFLKEFRLLWILHQKIAKNFLDSSHSTIKMLPGYYYKLLRQPHPGSIFHLESTNFLWFFGVIFHRTQNSLKRNILFLFTILTVVDIWTGKRWWTTSIPAVSVVSVQILL